MSTGERQAALDAFEATSQAALIGRAVVEWSGVDPSDREAVETLREALGFSSVPEACRTVGSVLAEGDGTARA